MNSLYKSEKRTKLSAPQGSLHPLPLRVLPPSSYFLRPGKRLKYCIFGHSKNTLKILDVTYPWELNINKQLLIKKHCSMCFSIFRKLVATSSQCKSLPPLSSFAMCHCQQSTSDVKYQKLLRNWHKGSRTKSPNVALTFPRISLVEG